MQRSAQLGLWAKEVFNQVGVRRSIFNEYETNRRQNTLAVNQKAEWSYSKMYGANYGDITDLLI